MELSDEQKQFLVEEFKKNPSLIDLTRRLFGDPDLDGRTKEGRAVRAFLSSQNLEYETSAWEKIEDIDLSEAQIDFIKNQAENGLSAFQISEILFPDVAVKRFSKQHLCVLNFLREYEPNFVHESESAINKEYNAPRTDSVTIDKINEFAHVGLKKEKVTHEEMQCVRTLMKSLSAPRFIQVIINYSS